MERRARGVVERDGRELAGRWKQRRRVAGRRGRRVPRECVCGGARLGASCEHHVHGQRRDKKVVIERGIPFDTKLNETDLDFLLAIREMQETSKKNGNCNMTLEEINEEIRLAREERRKKKQG